MSTTPPEPASPEPTPPADLAALREAIGSGDPVRAMPALAGLRQLEAEQAVPLLLLGLEQEPFLVRSLSCSGLGIKRNEAGWQALVAALAADGDANVRAEAANALASYGVERAWPLLRESFARDDQWLVRCSILSALAEQPQIARELLLELAEMAIADADGTVRVGGAEILGRLAQEAARADPPVAGGWGDAARQRLRLLQQDPDHRVVAAALNGLQS
ncbi:HEAT repeat domain-containing protein [Synechococcus sp. CS-1325]|uniref:HEAT repeat domain-containing protein n=1 Tax=unclassified Synechococcus TaxID=2626047 RepID=UPI000DB6317E|nr:MULTISPECIES: HEAT repeat domain-containing protein [unclassified Synechococcus]PZV01757.1 MAG: spore coat protein CotB [Cyanobium sp.]MCT0198483.1 HEAT repeat domain-containing protein [Synechococcus sp. CS-1325]MCT0213603.1 HEAT repeat domain-containing protein [Synechococcus sp. CS-1326]MCT0230417.1 HEAT repeat domain-containing protein [Synechococcus sp. CS-1324]MCT0232194.1 HEAT repeat domain-containing protein [Synechococcus sp. CS-1327]